ncbi:MAG: glycosyltransferase [Chthoniobacterales bacterium]
MLFCDLTQFYSPVGGGVRRYLSEKTTYLTAHGDRHLLIVPGEKTERREEGENIIWTIESPLISRTARYRVLLNVSFIEEILEQERPDLIESGDPYQVAWRAIAAGRRLGIPVVGFYHSHFPEATVRPVAQYLGGLSVLIAEEISHRYVTTLYNRFAKTVVPNPELAALLQGWGVKNTEVVEFGVDTNRFYPDVSRGKALREQLGLSADQKVLLYVGRLAPEKNVRTLLGAFLQLHVAHPGKYHLIVVGDGTVRGSVQRLQEKTRAITWQPYCQSPIELADFYRAANLFVHPGVHETFGLVTLESQACGTPVIAIQGTAMDRILFHTAPYGAKENTPHALTEAIEHFFSLQIDKKGVEIAAFMKSHYDWSHVFKKLFSIYRNVIASHLPLSRCSHSSLSKK